MKKNLPLLWAALLCLIGMSVAAQAQTNFRTAPAELASVNLVVESTRSHWQLMFPADELPEYGFKNAKELENALAGTPMQVYYMGRNQRSGAVEIHRSDEFLVPLKVNGQSRAFLTVSWQENKYEVVGVGEMNLALDASAYLAAHDNARSTGLIWLRDVNHSADFIAERGTSLDVAQLEFTPLFTAKRADFVQPLTYRDLVAKVQALPVQFD